MNFATIASVPHFTIRWTEALGLRTRQHSLDVDLLGESGSTPLRGHITADTQDLLGTLPAGPHWSSTRIVRDAAGAAPISALWQQVKRDRIGTWIPKAAEGVGHLGRGEIELVVQRSNSAATETFRTDLKHASQPVLDLLAAAAHVHADVRLHG
ncbi:MAG: hypothetical protein JWM98_634 [Thermoleophilia bacterium]|nr:hypothetical protein [Thermoleophilia bacterium]